MTTPTNPQPMPPTYQPPRACPLCGAVGMMQPRTTPITRKRRHKFGFLWLCFTLLTGGLAFFLWLVMPRYRETIAVDRFMICTHCQARVT